MVLVDVFDDTEPLPGSAEIMADIDSMPGQFRELVREFGYVIVRDMRADGYKNVNELRGILEEWRRRQQEKLLATDYMPRRKLAMTPKTNTMTRTEAMTFLDDVRKHGLETAMQRRKTRESHA